MIIMPTALIMCIIWVHFGRAPQRLMDASSARARSSPSSLLFLGPLRAPTKRPQPASAPSASASASATPDADANDKWKHSPQRSDDKSLIGSELFPLVVTLLSHFCEPSAPSNPSGQRRRRQRPSPHRPLINLTDRAERFRWHNLIAERVRAIARRKTGSSACALINARAHTHNRPIHSAALDSALGIQSSRARARAKIH